MLEVLIPAPNPEAVRAAVQNGADAVYIALGSFGDRALSEAVKYCRIRGARVYFSLPAAARDGEFDSMLKKALRASELGVSAIETGDLGMLRALRRLLPDMPIHFLAGAMNAAGAATAAYLGAARITLSPNLSLAEITELCKSSKTELELPCHGPVCVGTGICRMSSFIASGSACFGDCAMPCRKAFGVSSRSGEFHLSRKDICLADDIGSLRNIGLAALRVLGTERRPEYSALTARIYSAAVRGRKFDRADLDLLEDAFAPSGMTTGFFKGGSAELFGMQNDHPRFAQTILGDVRDAYIHEEADLVPVRLAGCISRGKTVKISIADSDDHNVTVEGALPKDAFGSEETGSAHLKTALYNLVGSPFYCTGAAVSVGRGLYVPPAELISLRQKAAAALAKQRAEFTPPAPAAVPELIRVPDPVTPPDINIYVRRSAQLSRDLAGLKPELLYLPITELLADPGSITPFWENGVTTICAVLPPLLHDGNDGELLKRLDELRELQVRDVLVNELGQIFPAAARGFTVRAGLGLGTYNSRTIQALSELRIASVTAPPELKLSEIKALSKALPTEAVLYGRVALLHSETDIADAAGTELLRDGRSSYPILPEYNGRSTLFSSDKLFLAPRRRDYENIGLWCGRLDFTTETAEECVLITQRFLAQNKHTPPSVTKGLYY
ncbi:MAG: DUF3656 domain-containing protein [Clostridiales bacterium]|nr:DUF3656 domain-containing protein [Clostridiales bacterium]